MTRANRTIVTKVTTLFLSDSFDDLNTTYNSQDPLFPGESNQPPMGSTNILAPRKKVAEV